MMSDFDQRIRDALRSDDLDQPGIVEMAASNFVGRQRASTIIAVCVSLVLVAVMVWSAVRFFRTDEVRDMVLFATIFLFLGIAVGFMKVWFWLMMIRYSLARDLRRLELRQHKPEATDRSR